MNAEVIAVGSEMLTPTKIDTNSLFLTQELNALGVEVVAKCVIGDDRARLTEEVRSSTSRSDLLTGGLGPTEDDVTRDAVAAGLGIGQSFDEGVWQTILERFHKFGRKPTENNRQQANVLDGAEILPNPNGTAPGQWIERNGRFVILLPGPPRELKPMVTAELIPRLAKRLPPQVIRTRWFRVSCIGESELDSMIAPIYTRYTNPATTVLASLADIDVHLRARFATEEEAEQRLSEVGDEIVKVLGDRIYSTDGRPLQQVVGDMLRERNATVAVAESCTGGLLGATLTETSGASDYFRGGFLTYTDRIKHDLLGIPFELLRENTAVSEPIAKAMAAGAKERTGADYAVSVTGYADGPNAGLIYIGLAAPDGTVDCRRFTFSGDRQRVRGLAVIYAVDMLRRAISAT